jgi:hypothetical protein
MSTPTERRLLRGARAISEHVFGETSGTLERAVYELRHEFPIFKLGRLLYAYEDALDAVLARKEAEADRVLRHHASEHADA